MSDRSTSPALLIASVVVVSVLLRPSLGVAANPAPASPLVDAKPAAVESSARPRSFSPSSLVSALTFEPNLGQTDAAVRFLARGPHYSVFLTAEEAVLRLARGVSRTDSNGEAAKPGAPSEDAVVRMRLLGARHDVAPVSESRVSGVSHYLIGRDPKRWQTDVPHYARVRYPQVYPGIDIVYYGDPEQLEYDLIVSPGADPSVVVLEFEGAQSMEIDATGALVFQVGDGEVRNQPPTTYQVIDGVRQVIPSRYVRRGASQIGFEVASYDPEVRLVIDPVLSYSTLVGGASFDVGRRIRVDDEGNVFATGRTMSADFPVAGGVQPTYGGGAHDAYVLKLDSTGSQLIYATYFGGADDDWGSDLAIDSSGAAYVSGRTASLDLPLANAFQPTHGGMLDAFIAKLDPSGGSLVFATYLGGGGDDRSRALALDGFGNVFVAGETSSTDFPLAAALQPAYGGGLHDGFVTKISSDGADLIFSTFLGGGDEDIVVALTLDGAGRAVATGFTASADFPLANSFQASLAGTHDAFVTQFDVAGESLVFSTYFGGSGAGNFDDIGTDVATDTAGNIIIGGRTSSADLPIANALQPTIGGGADAFVAKLDPKTPALLFSTYLGGSADDEGRALAVDEAGSIHLTGRTSSADFPLVLPTQATYGGGVEDAFVSVLEGDGQALEFSTFLGGELEDDGFGVDVDSFGQTYVTGETASLGFPTVRALQPSNAGSYDAFISRLNRGPEIVVSLSDAGAGPELSLSLENGAEQVTSVQLKLWIDVPDADMLISIVGGPATPVLDLPPTPLLEVIAGVPLGPSLPFPGTTIGARLLDGTTGDVLSESLCTDVPCH